MDQIKISIIIVNYNVKEYLAQSLQSIQRALSGISHEIYVVDNASVDGSVAYLRRHFPEVNIIRNENNVGFSKANNQALKVVKGEYVVLINPDTVVQEDTFSKLLEFFNVKPNASMLTCKIINPDGTFSVDCRHSIPTPIIAFWKVTGLSKLFPRSKIFGKYNLTYLNPDETYQVPAISGSFMMMKKAVPDRVGLFDEQFFMYCEDIDFCHRINLDDLKIYYVPATQIIHYKGESTKKDNLDYVITFNRSLYQFFKKYYAPGSIFLFRWLVAIGIFLRGVVIYTRNFLRNHFPLVLDGAILNGIILLAFIFRLSLKNGFHWQDYFHQYWVINLIGTFLFLVISFYFDIYPGKRFSIHGIIKSNIITFVLLASLTFFLKQFAFSRMVVMLSFLFSPFFMVLWRVLLRRFYRGEKTALGKDLFTKPTVVVGDGEDVRQVYEKLQGRREIDYELIGWISISDKYSENNSGDKYDMRHLGTIANLKEIIRLNRIRQVIFSAHSISYNQILKTMSSITSREVDYKMVPSNLDVIIGKSHIERLDGYPLLDIDYSIGKKFNRYIKRFVDVCLSLFLLIITAPYILALWLFHRKYLERVNIRGDKEKIIKRYIFKNLYLHSLPNHLFLLWNVLMGDISLVGAPVRYENQNDEHTGYLYKPGITGLVQLNQGKITISEDAEKYHLFYLKNQSALLDLEILLKSLWKYITNK
ncbi:MAG: glycosyltransferase [Calditrichia bacterium]